MTGAGCLPLQEDAATAANLLPTDEMLFGMTWPAIFALRDQMAHKYFRKFGQRIPLAELQSAGNEGIVIAQRAFPQAESGAAFGPYLGRTLIHRFLECWDEQGRTKVQRGTFTGFPITAIASYVNYERRHDAMRLLQYLPTITTPRNRAMLWAWLTGESDTAIGRTYHLDQTNVSRAIRKILHDLQVWAWHGEASPPPIRRRVTVLSQKDRDTIRQLAQEGMSIGALKRRYGVDRSGILRVLHQAEGEEE